MGSGASVEKGTFLTAICEEGEPKPECEEQSDEHDSSSIESIPYEAPPNSLYSKSDFHDIKSRHLELKSKYGKYFSEYMKEEIPRSIENASIMAERKLKPKEVYDNNSPYTIHPDILADMESRGSALEVKQHRKQVLNDIESAIISRNKALAFRRGMKSSLPCATFQDEEPNQFRSSFQHEGLCNQDSKEGFIFPLKSNHPTELDDSATIVSFRKHLKKKYKWEEEMRKKSDSISDMIDKWKTRIREKYLNYQYG